MTNAVSLNGTMLMFSRLTVATDDVDEILRSMTGYGEGEEYAPVVVDSEYKLDLATLKAKLWERKIAVIGVVAGVLDEQAQALHIPIFPQDKPIARLTEQKPNVQDTTTPTQKTLVFKELVRSGMQVYHVEGDLVVLESIRNGADVASAGNLYVYGKAGGRLMAGVTGDKNAHIFCQHFDPLLVSVAGTYCSREDIDESLVGRPVMVSLGEEQKLVFRAMA